MVTDISVRTVGSWGAEDRSWTIGEHGFDASLNAPLDFTKFTGANFTDGYIKSGCVLGKITASGKYGAYEPAATDGRQTAVGMLLNTTKIPSNTATVASDAILVHFVCREQRLPYTSGLGALDANARTAIASRIFLV